MLNKHIKFYTIIDYNRSPIIPKRYLKEDNPPNISTQISYKLKQLLEQRIAGFPWV